MKSAEFWMFFNFGMAAMGFVMKSPLAPLSFIVAMMLALQVFAG